MSLTPEQIATVKATVPALEVHGVAITTLFYQNLLIAHPELNNIFNHANQVHLEQPKALAGAVYAYAKNIENLETLLPTVRLIAGKHASLHVQPEHYPIVGKYLLEAIKEVLGDVATPEIISAWGAAYQVLANVFIDTEKAMYAANGNWIGFQDFTIAKIVKESDEISSFYLKPVNSELLPLPKFLPGQYISIQVDVPKLGIKQPRQYSLSETPLPDQYRVSIKRDSGLAVNGSNAAHPGLVSNIMHGKKEGDIVRVTHPQGDFYFDPSKGDDDTPVVLISAGVGLTPMTSILDTLAAANSPRPVAWVHTARSASVRAFANHVKGVQKNAKDMRVFFCNSRPADTEVLGTDYHWKGYVDAEKLSEIKDLLSNPKVEVFLCGPNKFMLEMAKVLKQDFSVPETSVKMELFGTGGDGQ